MCIVWSGGLLGDQLVASTNTGCLCQLKTQSSRLLHTINSAHTVDGLAIIVTRAALKGAGVFIKTSPCRCGCQLFMCCLTARRFLVSFWLFFLSCPSHWHCWDWPPTSDPPPVTGMSRGHPTMDVVLLMNIQNKVGSTQLFPLCTCPPYRCDAAQQPRPTTPHPHPTLPRLQPSSCRVSILNYCRICLC